MVGKLTAKTRMIKIVNMITRTDDVISVYQEETINDIKDRYLEYNAHANSYTWKALINEEFIVLDMGKTLDENNVTTSRTSSWTSTWTTTSTCPPFTSTTTTI